MNINRLLLLNLAVFIIFDIILLIKVKQLGQENALLKSSRVTLTLGEQTKLLEDELEGKKLDLNLNQFTKQLADTMKPYILLYHFWGNNCRRCMHMELTKRLKITESLSKIDSMVRTVMVFTSFNERDFYTLCRQYKISDYAIMDTSYSISKKTKMTYVPGIFLLSNTNEIIYAYYSNYKEPERMDAFYNRVINLLRKNI
jgi:hypothetical protein